MNTAKRLLFILTLCAAFASTSAVAADRLECNFGVADITPREPVALAGFAARKGLSNGIHRPIFTHCLVIRSGEERVCIITNDMMEVSPDFAVELRNAIAERSGIPYDCIFIHNTHTHSTPRLVGVTVEPGGTNRPYKEQFAATLVDNAVRTIKDTKAFRRFSIETGKGECFINCNRCEKNGPIDHDLYAARLVDRRGRPIVSLLNFSCHPVSLNHRSNLVSTDFPGIAVAELGREWGCPVFYFTGASGNVDPCGKLRADTTYTQGRGEELAEAASRIVFAPLPKSNRLKVVNRVVHLPYSTDHITVEKINAHAAKLSAEQGVSDTWVRDIEGWRQIMLQRLADGKIEDTLPIEIAAVNIGGLVMLFSQGEPFNEYQQAAREVAPSTPLFFMGYTNGQKSYLPSAHAFERREGYAYELRQMHIYVKAPWPLSAYVPQVYNQALQEVVLESQQ